MVSDADNIDKNPQNLQSRRFHIKRNFTPVYADPVYIQRKEVDELIPDEPMFPVEQPQMVQNVAIYGYSYRFVIITAQQWVSIW